MELSKILITSSFLIFASSCSGLSDWEILNPSEVTESVDQAVSDKKYQKKLDGVETFEVSSVEINPFDADLFVDPKGLGANSEYSEYLGSCLRRLAPHTGALYLFAEDGDKETGTPAAPLRLSCKLVSLIVEQVGGAKFDLKKEKEFQISGEDKPITISAEVGLAIEEFLPKKNRYRQISSSTGMFSVKSKKIGVNMMADGWEGGAEVGGEKGKRDDLNVILLAAHHAVEKLLVELGKEELKTRIANASSR
ncbi:MAG: hypothetical protein DWQ01_17305 [Planctomycetota bacterium]|nr:MAG: hypothetical protein DWQ01_17305 [Planctomycetota bacterium]